MKALKIIDFSSRVPTAKWEVGDELELMKKESDLKMTELKKLNPQDRRELHFQHYNDFDVLLMDMSELQGMKVAQFIALLKEYVH